MKYNRIMSTLLKAKLILFFIVAMFSCSILHKHNTIDSSSPLKVSDSSLIWQAIDNLDTAQLPYVTIFVNIHFVDSKTGNFYPGTKDDTLYYNGIFWTRLLINHANWVLRDLKFSPSSPRSYVGDSHIRYQLYSEPNEGRDSFGGIWFWKSYRDIKRVYDQKVMHVVFYDIDKEKDFQCRGYACGMHYCNEVVMMDAHDNARNHGPWGWWAFAGLMNHEVFHTFGLCHSFYCDNECKGIDIDPNKECHSNPCFNDCGGPHGGTCNNWDSGSQNIMGYNAEGNSITPCQWQHLYRNIYLSKALHLKIEHLRIQNKINN